MEELGIGRLALLIIFFIGLTGFVSAATNVNTNSVETSNVTSPDSQLAIGSVTNFTGNALNGIGNLFFSSTAYIVQESDGDDMVFQLDDSGGTRTNFLRLDNSALTTVFGVAVDMSSNQINNLADPTEAQDAATMSWVNNNDDFEADTNASTECSSGQVLTGSGCVSQYTSSDDGDSSLGNEGVNSLSFNTGNGVLTLGREHRSSLTQDLDGRYATSNTQLDDQAAQADVDMGSNKITNLANPTNSQDAATMSWVNSNDDTVADDQNLGDVLDQGSAANQDIQMNGNTVQDTGSVDTDVGWEYISSTQCSDPYPYKRIQLFSRNGDTNDIKTEFRVYVAADDNHHDVGVYSVFVTKHNGESRLTGVSMNHISGQPEMLEVMSNEDEVWIKPTGKWGSMYYRVESSESNGSWSIPLNTQCSDPSGMDVSDTQPFYYNWDSATKEEYPASTQGADLDMNTNQIQNADVQATEGLKVPVGTDAW